MGDFSMYMIGMRQFAAMFKEMSTIFAT
jgi:hypothetical protein